jgi:hypothetical protein
MNPLSVLAIAVLGAALALGVEHFLLSCRTVSAAEAPRAPVYKVVDGAAAANFNWSSWAETTLNQMAADGWELHSAVGKDLIFKKR